MENAAFFATSIGLTAGMYLGLRLSEILSIWFSKLTRAPRLVKYSSISGAFLFLVLSVPIAVFVGGMLGGGWGEELSTALAYGSLGVPVGLSLGIAIVHACGIVIGALIGGTIGKFLSHFLPNVVLNWRSSGGRQQLKNLSARDGEMLISDPSKWQELEDEHLKANLQLTKRTK